MPRGAEATDELEVLANGSHTIPAADGYNAVLSEFLTRAEQAVAGAGAYDPDLVRCAQANT